MMTEWTTQSVNVVRCLRNNSEFEPLEILKSEFIQSIHPVAVDAQTRIYFGN